MSRFIVAICGVTVFFSLAGCRSSFVPPPPVAPPEEYCADFTGWGILNAEYNNRLYTLKSAGILEIETFYTVVVGNGDGKTYTQNADVKIYNNYNWQIGDIYRIGNDYFRFGHRMQREKSDSYNIKIAVNQNNGTIILTDYQKELSSSFDYLVNESKNCFFWRRIETLGYGLSFYGDFVEYKSAIAQRVKYNYDIRVKNNLEDENRCLFSFELQESLVEGGALRKVVEDGIHGHVNFVVKKF